MILIADSGSSKTDWWLTSDEAGKEGMLLTTQGMNPFHQDEQQLMAVLRHELLPQTGDSQPSAIYFYGSGCREEKRPLMCRLLREAFPCATAIEAQGDLLGAARAVCGHSEGQACILGTGANSCLYDGHNIVANTPPLGYILGDEGSGAVLGIRFLNALYRSQLPETLLTDFEQAFHLTMAQTIDRVYRQPMANRFLASLSPFIHAHTDIAEVHSLVVDSLRQFFRRHLLPYGRQDLPVGAVGSIAVSYEAQLREAAQAEGFTLALTLKSPIKRLAEYHQGCTWGKSRESKGEKQEERKTIV